MLVFDLFIRCPFAKLIGKHSRYWWHVSASSSSSSYSSSTFQTGVLYSRRSFVNGPLVCEDFMPVLLGFLSFLLGIFIFIFIFLVRLGVFSCVEEEPPAVVFRSTNGRTPPRAAYPFDSLMVPFNELFIAPRLSPNNRLLATFPPFLLGNEMKEKDSYQLPAMDMMMKCVATTIWPKKRREKLNFLFIYFFFLDSKKRI